MVAMASGGNDYLIKPIDFQALESILDKYVKKRDTTAENRAGFH